MSSMVQDGLYFYGVTPSGGASAHGEVFRMSSTGVIKVLYSFSNGSDGAYPTSLTLGADGAFYGTTTSGGTGGYGTVFKVTTAGAVSTLYSFNGTSDGGTPNGGLAFGSDGKLYGTTKYNGKLDNGGSVFRVTTAGAFSQIHLFSCVSEGCAPQTGFITGSDGQVYGVTLSGGSGNGGTAYSISTTGAFKLLHAYNATTEGYSAGPLAQASDGSFYGSLENGANGYGEIYHLSTTGVLTAVYKFDDGYDGGNPTDYSPLTIGADGNLYGVTQGNGRGNAPLGSVFVVTPAGVLTTFHAFSGGTTDGSTPYGGLVESGTTGVFYGTANYGGTASDGTLFKVKVSQ